MSLRSNRPSSSRMLALGFVAGLLLTSPEASAFERQWHAGVKAGVATLSGPGLGPAVGVHGAYGLSDMFDVALEGLASRHGGSSGTDVLSGSLGLAYKIDVLEWIPYVGAYGGYYHYAGKPGPRGEHGSELGASFQLGLDYLLMRELALNLDLRWHASFQDGLTVPLFSATLGAEYRWGW